MCYRLFFISYTVAEPEIILKFVQKTFPIEIKFDQKNVSNLIRNFLL